MADVRNGQTINLTSSSDGASVGVDFTLSCQSNVLSIVFNRDGNVVCTITGDNSDGTCRFFGDCNQNYQYRCNDSAGVYNLTIPSSYDIDTLHGSNWRCSAPSIPVHSPIIQLNIYVPITQVHITTNQVDDNPPGIVVSRSKSFTCTTDAGRPSSRIQWYLSTDNITSLATPQPDTSCNNGKCRSSSELTYTGIKSDDGKVIYCTAVNGKGQTVRSENISINIWYGPSNVTISPQTPTYTVNESTGSVGAVTCQAHDCKPECEVRWIGPKFTGDTSLTYSVLNLRNIFRNQTGNYFCRAANQAWNKTSVYINVIVNYRPTKVTITPPSQVYTVRETTDSVGSINCTADCKPECTMTWNGPNIPDGTTSVLNLQNIDRNQAGDYQCMATNIIGSEMSVIVNIKVMYGPEQVNIEPNTLIYTVTETTGNIGPITCTAECNPNCSMSWTGPNIRNGASSVFYLQNIDRNQAGNYMCTATNKYGSKTSSTVSVIVEYGPRTVNIIPLEQNFTAIETVGHIGPINCTADCKPECSMTWNGSHLPESITSVLYLPNINKTQAGKYSCIASNSVSSLVSGHINVIVHYGPAVVDVLPQKQFHTVNETDRVTNITCTADCNPRCILTWTGPNLPTKLSGIASSMLNIPNIARNQSGTYTCNASNSVGSKISLHINISVNYVPAVNTIFGNRSFHENDTAVFSCNVESVPSSNITWLFGEQILGKTYMIFVHDKREQNMNIQVSTLNITQIGCLSMGKYTCAASNIIGEDTKRIEIDVRCSPRVNSIEYNVTKLIAVTDQEPLNITVPIIAYPTPYIFWTFVNNETSVNVTLQTSNSIINNRAFSSLYLENVTEKDFGHYNIYAGNGIGSREDYIYSVEVIPKRKPNPPDDVTCTGQPNSILVNWKSNFDGGDTQSFKVFFKTDGDANFDDNGKKYEDPGRNLYSTATINHLTPETTYYLRVNAVNIHNTTESEVKTCNTTSAVVIESNEANIVAIGAATGIGGAVVVLVIIAGVFIYVRRRKIDEKIGQEKELMQRSVDGEEDDEGGLKENPLYVSSQHEPEGSVYSVVNKNKKTKSKEKADESTIYTEVVKNQKKDRKNKEIEMGKNCNQYIHLQNLLKKGTLVVAVDAGWQKRGSGRAYDSKSELWDFDCGSSNSNKHPRQISLYVEAAYIVNKKLGLSPGYHTQRLARLRDYQRSKQRALATTRAFKRKRLEKKAKMHQKLASAEVREGVSYQTGCSLDAAISDDIQSIPAPVITPEYLPLEPKTLNDSCMTYVDVETTGLGRDSHIIQLSAVNSQNTKFNRYIKPARPILPQASEVTGLKFQNGKM
ncbi:hemicentin-1-like [Mytilus trossulus]|uniref:hemicentin-1-like n=1 Tax=Mytilus trossulus TaxID=6551 RepID=UPI00300559BB